MLRKMFELQRSLNQIIGRDTVNAPKELRDSWLFGYAFALQQEFGELYDCILHSPNTDLRIFDFENAKVEILDATHFIMSVFHILDISSDDVFENIVVKNYPNLVTSELDQLRNMFLIEQQAQHRRDELIVNRAVQLNQTVLEAWRKTDELLNTTSWKWWSAGVKESPDTQFKQIYFPEKAHHVSIDIFRLVIRIGCILDMSADDFFKVYQLKWEKNCARQENGYDVRNKTEADNLSIIASMNK